MTIDEMDLPYYPRLREALLECVSDKTVIRTIASDIGIDWGDVNPDGVLRSHWDNVIYAARKQGKIRALIEFVSVKYPENETIRQLLNDFDPAAEAPPWVDSRTFDMTSIQIAVSEERELSDLLILALGRLPKDLMEFATSSSAPVVTGGQHEAKAKDELSRYCTKCENQEKRMEMEKNRQKQQMNSLINESQNQISKIRSLEKPEEPTEPIWPTRVDPPWANEFEKNDTRIWLEREQANFYRKRDDYHKSLAKYPILLQKYHEAQATLPELCARLSKLQVDTEHAEREAANEIEGFRIEQIPKVAELERQVRLAKDRDLHEYLMEVQNKAASSLSRNSKSGIEEFTQLLLLTAVNSKCRETQTVGDNSLTEAFLRIRELIEGGLAGRHNEIARPWVAAVVNTLHTLESNKQRLCQIQETLNSIPEDELTRRLERLQSLLNVPLPVVPDYKDVVSPVKLDHMHQECIEIIQSLFMHISRLTDEQGEDSRDFQGQVSVALANAKEILDAMLEAATHSASIAGGITMVLTLMSSAKPSQGLWARQFSLSIQSEADRRARTGFGDLVLQSDERHFLWDDANQVILNHQSTSFFDLHNSLSDKIAICKSRADSIEEAATCIQRIPELERDSFLLRYKHLATATLVPFMNLVRAISLWHDVSRLQDAIGTRIPAYEELTRYGISVIRKSLLASMALFATALSVAWLASRFLPNNSLVVGPVDLVSFGVFVVLVTYPINLLIIGIILFRWQSLTRRALKQ